MPENNLDPRLQKIVEILDRRDKNWFRDIYFMVSNIEIELDNKEQFDHALQDIRDTFEPRMKRKKIFGIF